MTGLILILSFAPDTAMARWLSRWLIEKPAISLNRTSRWQWMVAMGVVLLVGVLIWFEAADGLRLLGMAGPDFAAWAVTFEITTYIDGLAAGVIAWSNRSRLSVRRSMSAVIGLRRQGARRRQKRSRRTPSRCGEAANDDDDAGCSAIAA